MLVLLIILKNFMTNKNFPHLMLKEIFSQPILLKTALQKYSSIKLTESLKIKNIKYFLFLACGTSYNASLYGTYIFEELLKIQSEVEYADQFISRKAVINKNTVVVAISQSGETGDVLKAILKAKKEKALIIGIANNKNSNLSKISDIFINLKAGKEKALEATKTYSLDLFSLLNLSLSLSKNKKTSILKELKNIPQKQEKILKQSKKIKNIAKKIKDKKNISILGSKFEYATALEAAQKFEETSYLLAKAYPGEEFRHGPKAIIEPGTLTIIIAPYDSLFKRNLKVIKEIKKAGGEMIIITDSKGYLSLKNFGENIIIPKTQELLFPFLSIIPLQLLSYYTSLAKKINVDSPRNLKKFIA